MVDFTEDFSTYAVTKLPSFSDNFSVDNWIDNNSAEIGVSGGVLNFNFTRDNTDDSSTRDLGAGNVSNERWVLRFHLTVNTLTSPSTGTLLGIIGLSDSISTGIQDFIGMMIVRTSGGVTSYRLISTNNIDPVSGIDSAILSTVPTASDNYFIEIKRLSASRARMTIFSDSLFSIVVERREFDTTGGGSPITSNINGLRYLKLQNIIATGGGSIAGTIDDLEFFSGSQIETSFNDDFSIDNWTDVGTDYFVGSGRNNFTMKRPNLQDNYDWRDIGFDLSDTEWVMRFKIVFTSNTVSTGAGTYLWVVMSSTTGGQQTAQDSIGMGFVSSSAQNDVFLAKSDGVGLDESTGFPSPVPINEFVGLVTRYVQVTRQSAISAKIEIFSDPAFSVSLGSQVRTIPAGITGLRYAKMSSWNIFASTYDGTQIGYIDDLQIWNNTTELSTGAQVGTRTFQDDFSGLDNWTDYGVLFGVNTGTDVLDWDDPTNSIQSGSYRDLIGTTVSDTNWTLKFKINITTQTFYTLNDAILHVGLFSTSSGMQTAQDGLFLQFYASSNAFTSEIQFRHADGVAPKPGTFDVSFTHKCTIETLFVKLKRTSATTWEASLFSDSAYTNLIERRITTCPSTITGLRYLQVASSGDPDATARLAGTIDDVEFYNDVSVANTPLKPIPELDFPFNTSTGWVQTGTGVSVNTTTQQIEGWSTDGAIDKRVTYDMGSDRMLNESDWTVEFEYEFSASSLPAHAPLVISNNNQNTDLFGPVLSDDVIGVAHGLTIDQLGIYTKDNLTATFSTNVIPIVVNTRYYVRLERIRDTTVKLSVFSDPDFTQHITSSPIFLTIASTIDNLRYIHSENLYSGSILRTLTGVLDNLKIYRTQRGTEKDNKYLVIG